MKKIISFVLALVMLLSLATSVSAYRYSIKLSDYLNYKETGEAPSKYGVIPPYQIPDDIYYEIHIADIEESWKNSYWYDAYLFCYDESIYRGYYLGKSQGESFDIYNHEIRPYESLTRGMMATFLTRYEGVDRLVGYECRSFADVEDGQWYSGAMQWAYDSGIIEGYIEGDTTLGRPEATITREEFVTMIYRYLSFRGYDVTLTADTLPEKFTDGVDVSDWALEAMIFACSNSIINGRTETEIAPRGLVTRAEAMTILYRINEISPCSEITVLPD